MDVNHLIDIDHLVLFHPDLLLDLIFRWPVQTCFRLPLSSAKSLAAILAPKNLRFNGIGGFVLNLFRMGDRIYADRMGGG